MEADSLPFAKAYAGLTDDEIGEVDAFVRRNTLEKFGPVHAVKPELVFELAFEAIQKSPRHKSGIAVRFPRMARWRRDKKAEEADSLDTIRALLGSKNQAALRAAGPAGKPVRGQDCPPHGVYPRRVINCWIFSFSSFCGLYFRASRSCSRALALSPFCE